LIGLVHQTNVMSALKIVNQDLHFRKVSLISPSTHCYLLIAMEVDHPLIPVFVYTSRKKKKLIDLSKRWCRKLAQKNWVIDATVFKATLIPPGQGKLIKERKYHVRPARFDVVILIEVANETALSAIQSSLEFKQIIDMTQVTARRINVIPARNVKQINPVDHQAHGVFLFNYFFADDVKRNLDVWEYTAGWFQQETGLNNSTVLLPQVGEQADYAIINHCRWNHLTEILPSLLFKKSFHSYVLDNFYANQVAAMPVLYKLA